jgi:hypothetical protein
MPDLDKSERKRLRFYVPMTKALVLRSRMKRKFPRLKAGTPLGRGSEAAVGWATDPPTVTRRLYSEGPVYVRAACT